MFFDPLHHTSLFSKPNHFNKQKIPFKFFSSPRNESDNLTTKHARYNIMRKHILNSKQVYSNETSIVSATLLTENQASKQFVGSY